MRSIRSTIPGGRFFRMRVSILPVWSLDRWINHSCSHFCYISLRQIAGPTPPTRRPLIRFGVVSSDRMHKTVMVSSEQRHNCHFERWSTVVIVVCKLRWFPLVNGKNMLQLLCIHEKISFCDHRLSMDSEWWPTSTWRDVSWLCLPWNQSLKGKMLNCLLSCRFALKLIMCPTLIFKSCTQNSREVTRFVSRICADVLWAGKSAVWVRCPCVWKADDSVQQNHGPRRNGLFEGESSFLRMHHYCGSFWCIYICTYIYINVEPACCDGFAVKS